MGYRSVVSFCLKVKEPEKFVALARLKEDRVIQEILEHMYYDDEGLLHFHADYWKWYDESESAMSELMCMAEDYDEDFCCRFARVGENTEDIEETTYGDDGWDLEYPYVVRTVESGVTNESKKVID